MISRKDLLDFIASTDAEQFYIDEGGLNLMADKDTYLEIGGDPNYGMNAYSFYGIDRRFVE